MRHPSLPTTTGFCSFKSWCLYSQMYQGWVTGWPLREVLCAARPVGCLLSAKPSSSLGKTHAPLRTDLMLSAIYSKSFRSQCDSVVGNRRHCLTSWVSNFSHCIIVPAGNVLERQIPRPAQTPWIKGSRLGDAHCEPCSGFRYLRGCKMATACKNVGGFIFSSVFFHLLAFPLKSDK